MAWNLTAQLIESCSCIMLCPCWYGVQELMVMDQGYCASPLLFRIQQGTSDGVDLSGCTVVLAADYPGPTLYDGNGTGRIYFDESLTANQQQELEAIFQGKKGGPMEVLAGLIPTWLPTEVTKIEIQEEDGAVTADVGNFGRIESQLLKSEAGQPMTMQYVGFATALQFEDEKAQLAPSNSHWHDPDMPRQYETKSGARSNFHWSVD